MAATYYSTRRPAGQSSSATWARNHNAVRHRLAIASVNSEITDLEAQRDALAVENAKITAAAADEERNEVASTMVAAQSSGFVSE